MDVLPAPALPDPHLLAQVPAAVLDRPLDDAVGRDVWWQVARCLKGSRSAVARAQEGTDLGSVAVLVSFAVDDTVGALATLSEYPEVRSPEPDALPKAPAGRVQVERTWFRLAGLLLGPSPADPVLLATVLADHATALAQWRQALRGAARPRRTPALVDA